MRKFAKTSETAVKTGMPFRAQANRNKTDKNNVAASEMDSPEVTKSTQTEAGGAHASPMTNTAAVPEATAPVETTAMNENPTVMESPSAALQASPDPEVSVGKAELTKKYEFKKVTTLFGSFQGSLAVSASKKNKVQESDEDSKLAIKSFNAGFESKTTQDKIESAINGSLVNLEFEVVELLPGVKITFSSDIFKTEIGEEVDFKYLTVEGNISGEIGDMIKGTPLNTPDIADLVDRGYSIEFKGSVEFSITNAAELKRIVEMMKIKKQLLKLTDAMERKNNLLKNLRMEKDRVHAEELKKFKNKLGIPEGKELNTKQAKKFEKYLGKSEAWKKASRNVNKALDELRGLKKLAKPLLSKADNIARKMVTPLGKIAAKAGMKTMGKIVSKAIPILGEIEMALGIVGIIMYYDRIGTSGGDTAYPWSDVPEKGSNASAAEGATEGKAPEGAQGESVEGGTPEGTSTEGTKSTDPNASGTGGKEGEGEGEGEGKTDAQKETTEGGAGKAEGSTDKEQEGSGTGTGTAQSDDKAAIDKEGSDVGSKPMDETSMDKEQVDNLMSAADKSQQAIFEHLRLSGGDFQMTETFISRFLTLPLSSMNDEELKRYLERLEEMGDLKTEDEILAALEKLMEEELDKKIGAGLEGEKQKQAKAAADAKQAEDAQNGSKNLKGEKNTSSNPKGQGGDKSKKTEDDNKTSGPKGSSGGGTPDYVSGQDVSDKNLKPSDEKYKTSIIMPDNPVVGINIAAIMGVNEATGETFIHTDIEIKIISITSTEIKYILLKDQTRYVNETVYPGNQRHTITYLGKVQRSYKLTK